MNSFEFKFAFGIKNAFSLRPPESVFERNINRGNFMVSFLENVVSLMGFLIIMTSRAPEKLKDIGNKTNALFLRCIFCVAVLCSFTAKLHFSIHLF